MLRVLYDAVSTTFHVQIKVLSWIFHSLINSSKMIATSLTSTLLYIPKLEGQLEMRTNRMHFCTIKFYYKYINENLIN